jgi:hypothetical protein
MQINFYYSLLVSFIIGCSVAIPTDAQGKSTLLIREGPPAIKDDQIIGFKNSLISRLLIKKTSKQKLRRKRDNNDSMDIKAIQAKINDHHTMIEDNRIMINNIINNSVNNNNIQEVIATHYSTAAPVWSSWRDVAIVFVVCVSFAQIIYFCACQVKLRPCDYFISSIFKRYHTRQSVKHRGSARPLNIQDRINMLHVEPRKYPSMIPHTFVKTIEDEYADINQNDGQTQEQNQH